MPISSQLAHPYGSPAVHAVHSVVHELGFAFAPPCPHPAQREAPDLCDDPRGLLWGEGPNVTVGVHTGTMEGLYFDDVAGAWQYSLQHACGHNLWTHSIIE